MEVCFLPFFQKATLSASNWRIDTWKSSKIRFLHSKISKSSETGTGMCPPLFLPKIYQNVQFICIASPWKCFFSISKTFIKWQKNVGKLHVLRRMPPDYLLVNLSLHNRSNNFRDQSLFIWKAIYIIALDQKTTQTTITFYGFILYCDQ